MFSEPIEIAIPSDENYFPGLLVTAYSMAKNASPDVTLSFNILDGGIEDSSFELLKASVIRIHPNSLFARYKVEERDFSNCPTFHGNRMTYVRFLLPRLLNHCSFVIYADSDCLWLADVSDIWECRDNTIVLQAVHDEIGYQLEHNWFESRGLDYSGDKYFCNGLLLINLDLFREENIIKQCSDFIMDYPELQFADQSAFNRVIQRRVVMLPDFYNFFTRDVSREDVSKPIVLHYANDLPWVIKDPGSHIYQPPYRLAWLSIYSEALRLPLKVACRQLGYAHNAMIHKIFTWVLPKRRCRHVLFGILILMGKRNTLDSLRKFSARTGKLA